MANVSTTDLPRAFAARQHFHTLFSSNLQSQLIRCDIIFGMPSQDCRGTGICKLTSDMVNFLLPAKECRRTAAFAGRANNGSRISLFFLRELLCIELFRHHFRKGVLQMQEPCSLPDDLVENLGLQGDTLLPGTYMVTEENGCFRVDIDCGARPEN